MDGRMSATDAASVVGKPFTLLLLLFPGQDRTHRDVCTTTWGNNNNTTPK